jgi:hypothetical protein
MIGREGMTACRWCQTATSRIGTDGNELPLPHEFLAIMRGVRRAGATVALHSLERTGLIAHRRGVMPIFDRGALEKGSKAPLRGLRATGELFSFSRWVSCSART